jgi:hypothetical protein
VLQVNPVLSWSSILRPWAAPPKHRSAYFCDLRDKNAMIWVYSTNNLCRTTCDWMV